MSDGGSHRRVRYRRERDGKTDYRYRARLLQSGKPRLVARISLQHVRAQIVVPGSDGDDILASAFSKELSDWDWEGNTSNIPAAYLVGFLCGLRAKDEGVDSCVMDIGRFVPESQAKIFAVLKGATDAGLEIPHKEEILPSDERCRGEHIADYADILKSEGEDEYLSQFSGYEEKDIDPEEIPEHFKQVKEAIKTKHGE